ncbi:MAG: hypothetical protein KC443_17290 [Anaerolineales bacterium]|nr:hypothetical protein [Anaerolineales bacterium]
MFKRIVIVLVNTMLLMLLLISVVAAAQDIPTNITAKSADPISLFPITDPVTVITVTSGTDPDDSNSKTCYTDPVGPPGPPTTPCTLRRAIVEASALGPEARPILIRFDIPEDPAEGYDPVLDVWKIELYATTDTVELGRLKDGQVIIDGSTQPGGRSDGPKIILLGPGTGNKDGLVVGDVAGDNANEIRGLAFQNFRVHLYVNTNDNIIENNWFGLSDDGTEPVLRDDDPENGTGTGGIDVLSAGSGNLIQNNVFLGFDGTAASIRGEDNIFQNNLVGTKADGTIDKQTLPSLICTEVDWLGGGGLTVQGNGSQVLNNTFAGVRQQIFAISTQPSAIVVAADDIVVQENIIGIDSSDTKVGVCGRAIYLAGANDPEDSLVISNTIVNPGMSGISVNGALANGNTLWSNIIEQSNQWIQVDGNALPETAIQLGKSLPDAYELFNPAQVTEINGTSVTGSSGVGSPCPNCLVQVFLDDTDLVTETLQFLGETTADASGNWSLTLPFTLSNNQGLRTTSTSNQFNVIPGMRAGTTTKLSLLYTTGGSNGGDYEVFLPFIIR